MKHRKSIKRKFFSSFSSNLKSILTKNIEKTTSRNFDYSLIRFLGVSGGKISSLSDLRQFGSIFSSDYFFFDFRKPLFSHDLSLKLAARERRALIGWREIASANQREA